MATQSIVPSPATASKRARKSVAVAVILQSIPLLGAGGCTAMAVSDQQAEGLAFLLWLSVLFWGLGYAYAGLRKRFVLVLLLGPVFALVSCTASMNGVSFDYEHTSRNTPTDSQSANRASLQEALIIAASVVLLAVNVWRVVAVRNDEVGTDEPSPDQPGGGLVEPTAAPQPVGGEERGTGPARTFRVRRRKRIVT